LALKFEIQLRYRIHAGFSCSMMVRFALGWALVLSAVSTDALPLLEHLPHRKRQELAPSSASAGAGQNGLVEEVEGFAEKQAHAVSGGIRLLADNTRIVSSALFEAVVSSASKLGAGDFQGVLQVANDVAGKAEEAASSANSSASSSSWTAAKLLLLFVFVASLWGFDALLSSQEDNASLEVNQEEQPKRLPALDFLRYFLSWMVVLYNYYPWTVEEVRGRSGDPIKGFASWGLLASPLFFVLSGFCLAYSKTLGPKADIEEPIVGAMVARIMPWYPMYVIVLIFLSLYYISYNAEDWANFMAQLFLFNGAALASGQDAFPYLPEAWWFSYLAIYLLSIWPLQSIVSESSLSVIWTVMTICCLAVFPLVILEWLWSWEEDNLWILAEYAPSFLFGQALATWQIQSCMLLKLPNVTATKPVYMTVPTEELPVAVRAGVTMSVLLVGIMMTFCSIYDTVLWGLPCTSWLTKGLLLPVFGMLITGLAAEVDPIAKIFARKPFCWAGRLSMSQFLLALPVHIFVENWLGQTGVNFAFVLSLTVASIAGHFFIEKPSRQLACYLCQARPAKMI